MDHKQKRRSPPPFFSAFIKAITPPLHCFAPPPRRNNAPPLHAAPLGLHRARQRQPPRSALRVRPVRVPVGGPSAPGSRPVPCRPVPQRDAGSLYAWMCFQRKAACNSFPRVSLFPEGTTTNGRFLISFQHGAFIPGYPVQPVLVRYPHVHFDQSWGNISLLKLMFKMFTQFHNFMETSYAMAQALNALPTSYSYGDSMIMARVAEAGKENCSNYLVEMAWVKDIYGVSTAEAMEHLEYFLDMNPGINGRVKVQDFWALFGLDCSLLCKKIFHYFDFDNKESITFRQFLIGCAHLRKRPLFQCACGTAFEKCRDAETSDISQAQLADVLRLGMLLPSDDGMPKLFKTFDIDNDEKISRDDFVTCLSKFPFLIALFAGPINGEVYIEIV